MRGLHSQITSPKIDALDCGGLVVDPAMFLGSLFSG